jgi:flagellar capping protein FliD
MTVSSSTTTSGVSPTNQGTVSFTGLGSGLNYQTIIAELTAISQKQEVPYQNKVASVTAQNNEISTIQGMLNSLQGTLRSLSDPTTFSAYDITPSNTSVLTATQTSGATPVAGTYNILSTSLGTATSITGATTAGQSMSNSINGTAATNVPLASSYAAVTPTNGGSTTGTVTIDGVQVSYDVTSQSLTNILSNIQTAVQAHGDAGFTATYDASTDEVTFASTDQAISYGSSTDTGNLLAVLKINTAQLSNGASSGSVTSSSGIGGINEYRNFSSTNASGIATNAGFTTAVTAGAFTINGVSFTVNPSTQALSDVIGTINSSAAGVTASFDSSTGKVTLTNNSVGAQSIVLGSSGDTSNFLSATGLTSAVTSATFSSDVTAGNISINGTTIAIDPTTQTLTQAIAAINSSGAAVTASINAQTGNLSIVNTNGIGTPTFSRSTDTSNFLVATNAIGSSAELGTQTSVTYTNSSGVTATAYANSNIVTNAIAGVSLTVLASGSVASTVSVARSSSTAETAVNSFVTAYNNVITELNSATAAPVVTQSSSGGSSSSVGGGVFFGNSIIEQLKNQLVNLVSTPLPGATNYNSLASIGLKLDSTFSVVTSGSASTSTVSGVTNTSAGSGYSVTTFQGTDGAFQALDTTTFEAAFASNPNAVSNLFTNTSSFVDQLGVYMTDETGDDTILASGVAGTAPTTSVLAGMTSSNSQIISNAQSQITALQKQITNQANMLNTEYSAASANIAALQSEQSYLTAIGGSATSSTGS